jgi:hypothetical protein
VAWLSIVIIGHVLGYRRDGVVIPVQSVRSVFMYLSCVVLCCVVVLEGEKCSGFGLVIVERPAPDAAIR